MKILNVFFKVEKDKIDIGKLIVQASLEGYSREILATRNIAPQNTLEISDDEDAADTGKTKEDIKDEENEDDMIQVFDGEDYMPVAGSSRLSGTKRKMEAEQILTEVR